MFIFIAHYLPWFFCCAGGWGVPDSELDVEPVELCTILSLLLVDEEFMSLSRSDSVLKTSSKDACKTIRMYNIWNEYWYYSIVRCRLEKKITWQSVSRASATSGRFWLLEFGGVSGAEEETLVGVGTVGGVFDLVRSILKDGSGRFFGHEGEIGGWGVLLESVCGMCHDTPCYKFRIDTKILHKKKNRYD